jgi:hypothetical protein
MRDMSLRATEARIKRYRAEKRAGLTILAIVSITLVTAVMIHLDATLKSGRLGV